MLERVDPETIEVADIDPPGERVKEGIAHIALCFIDPGDVALVPDPGYPIYESQIEFYGGVAHPYGYVDTYDGLRLDFDAIEAGIWLLTEDRKDQGLVLCRSVRENFGLPNLSTYACAQSQHKSQQKWM